jgi:hypothetical protein
VRRDIERTRSEMSYTVDQIEDRVVPSRIIEHRKQRMRNWFDDMRDNVMGTVDDTHDRMGDAGSSMGDTMHEMAENVQHMPQMARRRTQGSPIGAGLFALGAGLVLGSMLPASRAERQAAQQVMPKLEPLKDQAREAVSDLKENMREPAQEAVQAVTDRGKEAGQSIKEQATDSAQEVKQQSTTTTTSY